MTLNEYQVLTSKTYPELGDKLNRAHMVMGICSEINELIKALLQDDKVNASEELADKEWYLSNYCRLFNINYADLEGGDYEIDEESGPLIELTIYTSKLQDLEKKYIAYNKPVDEQSRLMYCKIIFACIQAMYKELGISGEQSRINNIDKLRVRFGDKFSEEKANNRDLVAERAELEK